MRTKAKAALIAAAAVVGVAGGVWLTWCSGINYERRYKKLFDKTFKGDYKVTVTESGFYTDDEAPLKLPTRYKKYDIEYKDKDGNERHIELDGRVGYEHNHYSDENLFEYIKNKNFKADQDIMWALTLETCDIARNDLYDNIISNYFDVKRDPESVYKAYGDGYTIISIPFEYGADFIYDDHTNEDKMYEIISPESCPVLSDIDMKTAADIETFSMTFYIDITDESKYGMMNDFTERTEALFNDYSAASDFGGNYKYSVRTTRKNDDETEIIDRTDVYVVNGEKVDLDPEDKKINIKFRDMIIEKSGYDILKE